VLIVENIITYYGKIRILKEVTIQVEKGQIVTLLGGNGAGKTTTVRTISGLVKPASGKIEFRKERIDGLAPELIARKGIAHVPQGAGVFTGMTVMENLELGFGANEKRGKKQEALQRVYRRFPRLGDRIKQKAGTLSGGERQMLGIGRALMSSPDLLILDEPSFGLSPLMVKEIAEILKQLREDGTTIFLIEQNARMALSISDIGYVLDVGKVVLHEKASALIENEHIRKAYLGI
jgi:branched-chain amino acid transport system ATP-binding protein